MKKIETEISIDIETLRAHESYIDKLIIPELNCYIVLTIRKEKSLDEKYGNQLY